MCFGMRHRRGLDSPSTARVNDCRKQIPLIPKAQLDIWTL